MEKYKILAYASALAGSLFMTGMGMTMQKMSEDLDSVSKAKMYNEGTNLKDLGLGAGYLVVLAGVGEAGLSMRRRKRKESLKSLDGIFE